ncbi:D-alanyl-D-alanine carboxypeptidase [Amycolatopsis pretoriensis]|uniref:D-alanyl-D-alanine carboxypeptidase n=1 Tax=Amycolatopsis pretoriensis TaxID=218821 RepID=A0A1H5RJF5_9PSEU|nr:serine hydrolase domain-containing protein [Amycolatopsis pretoriensis]SEF38492.1 D-alanyl-D-alanine carboxypeptidase [Amycolatopsis pretoriensis]
MKKKAFGRRATTVGVVLAALAAGAIAYSSTAQPAVASQQPATRLGAALHDTLQSYLDTHRTQDRMSTVALRVTYPDRRPATSVSVSTGRAVPDDALWQIGSNTKAFTSVLLLRLEAEGRLSISDKLGKWLPEYSAWRDVTITQLLSMTSRIPDYAQQDAFGEVILDHPATVFTPKRLVSFVADLPLNPIGYGYSNTNYLLAQMIIERVTHDSFDAQLHRHILGPLKMQDTCLPPACPRDTARRMPAGYSGVSALPTWLGKPVPALALSWAQGAGGLIGSLPDLTTWAKALYQGRLLPPTQQRELQSLVSATTGKPIRTVTPQDPVGFGLGIAQRLDAGTGRPVWAYRGETFGFQVLHTYVPDSGLVITLAVNSTANEDTLTGLADTVHRMVDESRSHAGR